MPGVPAAGASATRGAGSDTVRTVRQLLPIPLDDVDGPERYRQDERSAVGDRTWLTLNMVTSTDGATAVEDASAGLSSPADRAIFLTLRGLADVVMAGAGTVRDEDYGPTRLPAEVQERRKARGQDALPCLAIVSRRLDLDPGARVFSDPTNRPIVLTVTNADPARQRAVAEVAEVIPCGEDDLDLVAALQALHQRGAQVTLCEGGPTLNGHLIQAGLVDELCLTLAPLLAGGPSARLAHDAASVTPEALGLDRALEDDGFLFLRYLRRPS